ncbi:hypothetical protein [Roseateles amylovorans]|uniref:YopN family type III secretion system gatekeeper subunit n=1 Tax=Roseateles amylovorans TaxID=2978473 RepID=A0ABY6B5E6_9BURK|nr:hypothetical protein [Roseateles amylovorans]UXH79523.1 hypothetical protein N4261_06260 [Roseateles amylovorans]
MTIKSVSVALDYAAPLPTEPVVQQRKAEHRRQEPAHPDPELRPDWLRQAGSLGLKSDSFEEITFQSSESEEAKLHDDELDRGVEGRQRLEASVPVEQVRQVMRLMESNDGYMHLRSQARRFAELWARDPQAALDHLAPSAYPPAQRYAVIRMAAELMEKTEGIREPQKLALVEQFQAIEQSEDPALRRLFAAMEAAAPKAASPSAGSPTDRTSSLMQLLSSRPTARVLLDSAPSLEGIAAFNEQARQAPESGRFNSPSAEVGMLVGMARLVGLVRTMGEHGASLMTQARTPGAANPATVLKVTRALFDVCGSAAPAPLMEKLFSGSLQVTRLTRPEVEGHLLSQIPKFPEAVWLNLDTKSTMQKVLRDSLGMEYRRQGLIGPTGTPDRTESQRARLLRPAGND